MNKAITVIIVIIVLALGGYWLLRGGEVQAPNEESEETPTLGMPVPGTNTPEMIVIPTGGGTENAGEYPEAGSSQSIITYTDAGYSPATLRVKLGDTVTWTNNGSSGMWTASASHPSHMMYAGTNLEEHCPDATGTALDTCTSIQSGGSWSFTFNKKGEWKYHNHVNPGHFGTVVVE